MKKILEYSEFVSGESIKDKLIRLEKKWITNQDEVHLLSANNITEQNERRKWFLKKYEGLILDLGRLLPLDSENSEEIAEALFMTAESSDIGYIIFYMVNYFLSRFTSYSNYVNITPIKWITVK